MVLDKGVQSLPFEMGRRNVADFGDMAVTRDRLGGKKKADWAMGTSDGQTWDDALRGLCTYPWVLTFPWILETVWMPYSLPKCYYTL